MDSQKFKEKKFPRERILITDPLDAARNKNRVCGVFEFNVTLLKQESKKNKVSFLSSIIYAAARAAEKNPQVNSYRKGGAKLIEFSEVDICIVVERITGKVTLPLPYIIRNANYKSLQEIDNELIIARKGDINDIYMHRHMRLYLLLPKFMRILFWKYILQNPFQFKARLGTIAISALHSRGYGLVHFDPLTPYTFTLALGRISKNEKNEDIMNITFCIDHDILDGMDVIKFASSFAKF